MKKLMLFLTILSLIFSTNILAQDSDFEGSKDYPLIPRFENSVIKYYKIFKWQDYKIPLAKVEHNDDRGRFFPKQIKAEGKIIRYQYTTTSENNPAYVYKTILDNLKNNGFQILFSGKGIEGIGANSEDFCNMFYSNENTGQLGMKYYPRGEDSHCLIVAKNTRKDKNIYAVIYISGFSDVTLITQDVIEADKETTLSDKNITENLDVYGHIAVYSILFGSGSAEIKPESQEAIKKIADYINAHPDKKFVIVGHTDNHGDFDANIKLSQQRAQNVMNELLQKYSVRPEQVNSYGDGCTSPVSSNYTEEGRALNRRVEIVEL